MKSHDMYVTRRAVARKIESYLRGIHRIFGALINKVCMGFECACLYMCDCCLVSYEIMFQSVEYYVPGQTAALVSMYAVTISNFVP